MRKLSANCNQRISATAPRKTKVHQSDIRTMTPEFCDGFRGVRSLRDHQHVSLRANDHTKAFAKNRVVFNAEYGDRFRIVHCSCADYSLQCYQANTSKQLSF